MPKPSQAGLTNERFSARYVAAVQRLLVNEGGFVDDPKDKGGTTNFGISLRFLKSEGAIDLNRDGFADFDLDMDGDIDGADIRMLTRADAVGLYHRCFWQRLKCESYPQPLGEALFDQAVNGGAVAACKMLQRAINACYAKNPPNGLQPLNIDGVIGRDTRMSLDSVLQYPGLGMPALMREYRAAVSARYREIVAADPSQKRFLKGWLARAEGLGRA